MEAFHLPPREVRKRFTRSDVVIMGWRAAEVAYNMHSRSTHATLKRPDDDASRFFQPDYNSATDSDELRKIEERLGPVAYKMVNSEGQVDLRKLTGDEALTYFAALGIPLGRL